MTPIFKHVNRRAKIVATIGPKTDSVEMIREMIFAGMNIARINMSHGDHDGHRQVIENIRKASKELGNREAGILLDLCGPKIRVGHLESPLPLKEGESWILAAEADLDGSEERAIPSGYPNVVDDCAVGDRVLFDDGLLAARVTAKTGRTLFLEIMTGGELKSRKGINLPDSAVSAPGFTEKDKQDLEFGLANGIDFVALSFVRKKEDVEEVRHFMNARKVDLPIIAKIEKPEAVKEIDSILSVTDAIMVARGDMGVEVGNHLVPAIQKSIIRKCNDAGIPVITATQMLESMISNPTPTRAEASDVANAIWDGTDAVMLSGETAVGKYPIETITMMGQIIEEAEKTPKKRPSMDSLNLHDDTASLMFGASLIAEKTAARRIVSITTTGRTCQTLSRFRPRTFVLGVTNSRETARKMCLYWGISPFYLKPAQNMEESLHLEYEMLRIISEKLNLTHGDKIILTRGQGSLFREGESNSIRVINIETPVAEY
jgi:pyruvate kinase